MDDLTKVLVTCPPMLGMIDRFIPIFEKYKISATTPDVIQSFTEKELIDILPSHDGWIIGDDPATRPVVEAGVKGKFRAAVRWGIGVDNVDFGAFRDHSVPIANTPGVFGKEVADMAVGYVIALARETFSIDRMVRTGTWHKPRGISLDGKKVALVGYGNIGANIAKRLVALDMDVSVYDPYVLPDKSIEGVQIKEWPTGVEQSDFIVLSCPLSEETHHLIDMDLLNTKVKKGVRVINVSRGGLIEQAALENALKSGLIHSVALDVYEVEPLSNNSYLKQHPLCILGSHNSSNTVEAVERASQSAIRILSGFLNLSVD